MYFLGKVKFETIDDNNGRTRTTREEYLIEAETVQEAADKLNVEFKTSMAEVSVEEVKKSKIVGILN